MSLIFFMNCDLQSIDLKFDKDPLVTIRRNGAGTAPSVESNRHSETSMGSNE